MTPPPTQTPPGSGPAWSMSLLTELVDDAVRSDYTDEAVGGGVGARDTGAGDRDDRRRRWAPALALTLVVVGGILAGALAQARGDAAEQAGRRAELVARVEAATAANADIDARIRDLRVAVSDAEARAVADSAQGRDLAERATQLATAAQYTEVTGPGVVVTLDDAEDAAASESELGRVLDVDLQLVVNGLWRAGASAISVDGHRLSSRTAIRSAGGAILVDYRPLRPPYEVAALAGGGDLRADFEAGSAGRALQGLSDDYGLRWSLDAVDPLTLSPADSALPQFATVPEGAP